MALLEADVNYKVAKEFTAKVTERAIGAEVMESLTPAQMVIKIVNEELTALMGGSQARLDMPSKPPAIVMLCGLRQAGQAAQEPGSPPAAGGLRHFTVRLLLNSCR